VIQPRKLSLILLKLFLTLLPILILPPNWSPNLQSSIFNLQSNAPSPHLIQVPRSQYSVPRTQNNTRMNTSTQRHNNSAKESFIDSSESRRVAASPRLPLAPSPPHSFTPSPRLSIADCKLQIADFQICLPVSQSPRIAVSPCRPFAPSFFSFSAPLPISDFRPVLSMPKYFHRFLH
jgi:hypothetical protein